MKNREVVVLLKVSVQVPTDIEAEETASALHKRLDVAMANEHRREYGVVNSVSVESVEDLID